MVQIATGGGPAAAGRGAGGVAGADQMGQLAAAVVADFGVGVVAGATGDGIMMRFRELGVRGRAGDAGRSGSRARRRCRRGAAR